MISIPMQNEYTGAEHYLDINCIQGIWCECNIIYSRLYTTKSAVYVHYTNCCSYTLYILCTIIILWLYIEHVAYNQVL